MAEKAKNRGTYQRYRGFCFGRMAKALSVCPMAAGSPVGGAGGGVRWGEIVTEGVYKRWELWYTVM